MSESLIRASSVPGELYSDVEIRYDRFKVLSNTPKGKWIKTGMKFKDREFVDIKRWVSDTSKKRYAYPTEEEAAEALVHRKLCQIAIINGQKAHAITTIIKLKGADYYNSIVWED